MEKIEILFKYNSNSTSPKSNNKFKLKMSAFDNNYIKKIQEHTGIDEGLHTMLVDAHQHLSYRSPYLLRMINPKLEVTESWHNTITSALDRANLFGGEYIIYLNHFENMIDLTSEDCELIRQCEEGELDPEKGCSIALAKEARAAREAENYTALLEEAEGDEELLEMWVEKMDRPGRKLARGSDESAIDILLREKAMNEIYEMSAREFQSRLLDGTLPDFPREKPPTGPIRDTCHTRRLLTEKDFLKPQCISNYAQAHKDKLRYMSAENFKYECYQEFDEEF